uniref:Uncharacterized protein n=1 Tax=viral metagenome TaxID=1070528 RepID=A0A6H1ZS46_9ZZZZ
MDPSQNELDTGLVILDDGYVLFLRRNGELGHLCGYVGVPKNHPLYERDYGEDSAAYYDIDIHGGVTFTNYWDELIPAILHRWYIGFDCAHLGDMSPRVSWRTLHVGTYRDYTYVSREIISLYLQLKAMEVPSA